jgi:hypothetical protein
MKRTTTGIFLIIMLLLSWQTIAASDINTTGLINANNGIYVNNAVRISSAGVGTFAAGTTIGAVSTCLADGTNCPTGSGAGWVNNSGSGNVSLTKPSANVSAGILFIDNTNGRIGVNTSTPEYVLDVLATPIGVDETTSSYLKFGHYSGYNGGAFYVSLDAGEFTHPVTISATPEEGVYITQSLSTFALTQSSISFSTDQFYITSSGFNVDGLGSVGVGTILPSTKLHVNTTSTTTGLRITTNSNTTSLTGDSPMLELVNTNASLNQSWGTNNNARIVFTAQNITGTTKQMAGITAIFKNHTNQTTNYNGILTFSTIGSGTLYERVRIDENGYVGIGTTSPRGGLDVAGRVYASEGAYIQTGEGTDDFLVHDTANDVRVITVTDGTNILFNPDASSIYKVGIGTSSPTQLLHVAGNVNISSGNISMGYNSGIITRTGARFLNLDDLWVLYAGAGSSILAGRNSAGTTLFIIDPFGRMGVGTGAPLGMIHINSTLNDESLIIHDTGGSPTTPVVNITRANNQASPLPEDAALYIQDVYTNYPLHIVNNTGGALFTVRGNGNVGIGTTSPALPLEINGSSANDISMRVANANAGGSFPNLFMAQMGSSGYGVTGWGNASLIEGQANGGLVLSSYNSSIKFQTGNSRTIRMVINDTTGNIGINTTSPVAPLHIASSTTTGAGQWHATVIVEEPAGEAEILLNPGTTGGNWSLSADDTTNVFRIFSNGSARFYINGDTSKVGVNTSAPIATFEVAGTINSTGNIYENNVRVATSRTVLCNVANCTVNNLVSGQKIKVWAKGTIYDLNGDATTYTTTLKQNSTNVDQVQTWRVDTGSIGSKVPFALMYYNDSVSQVSMNYSISIDNGNQLRDVMMMIEVSST